MSEARAFDGYLFDNEIPDDEVVEAYYERASLSPAEGADVDDLQHPAGIQEQESTRLTTEQQRLVEQHMGFATGVVIKYVLKGRPLEEDIQQAAYLGLIKSASKYRADMGVDFMQYAFKRVVGAAIDYERRRTPLTRTGINELKRWRMAEERLSQKLQRSPTQQEIIEELSLDPGRGEEMQRFLAGQQHFDLIAELVVDNSFPSAEEVVDDLDRKRRIAEGLAVLSERERSVIERTSLEEIPLTTIAQEDGITVQGISNLRRRALSKMRAVIEEAA
jgi:RNA polymerase sigma factor for flagellar operon FliA